MRPETALFSLAQHESTAAEPLDELYDTLADILNEEESTHCYKNYLLVRRSYWRESSGRLQR